MAVNLVVLSVFGPPHSCSGPETRLKNGCPCPRFVVRVVKLPWKG